MNCLLVPTLAYDLSLLNRLAKSIDYPIENKVVINNGHLKSIAGWSDDHPDWQVINLPENIGVAASWNLAPKLWPFEDAWLICNDDQEFQPGCLEQICIAADAHSDSPVIYVNGFDAYDVFVWTRYGVNQFGYFDENFYPAYFEDYEYRCRLKAADAKPYRIASALSVKHGRVRPAGKNYMRMLDQCRPLNQQYLEEKWGTRDDQPKYQYPFDIPKLELSYWVLDGERRAVLKDLWDDFWNNTPSVYE